VSALAFAKTGHDLVSGAVDGSLLYTPADSDSLVLAALPGGVDAVGLTPDRHVIVTGPLGRLRIHDLHRNSVIAELDASSRVRSFRLSADGLRLITVPRSGPAVAPVLWDLEHYRVIAPLEGHIGVVFSARFVDSDRSILTVGGDGAPRLWDGMTGRLSKTYIGNEQYLLDAILDPDGAMVVAAAGDGALRFWDAASGQLSWTLRAHQQPIAGVHFDGRDLITRGATGEIARWSVPKLLPMETIDRAVQCLPLHLDAESGVLEPQRPCAAP